MFATMKPGGYFDTTYKERLRIIYTPWQWGAWICFLVLITLFPIFVSSYLATIGIRIGISIISVIGLNIIVGSTGLLSVGHAAFMAVGAYCSSILMSKLGFNFFPSLLTAGLMGGIAGLIFGAPSLRIKGFYVALATLAGHFIIIWLLMEWFGGATAQPAPRPQIFGIFFDSDISYYYLVAVVTIFFGIFARNLLRSKIGRAFVATRDNDIAAEILGVNIYAYKLLSFFVGCFYAGVSGCLMAHFWGFTNIQAFPFDNAIWYLGMVIVGGMGSVLGSVFGATFFVILEELSFIIAPSIAVLIPSFGVATEAAMKWLIFSGVIIVFVIFEPNGMAHRWNLIKASFRIYPFNY